MSFSKDVNVGPCSVQQRPGCTSDVAAAAALRCVGVCAQPKPPVGCCGHGGLQDRPPHGLNLPGAAARLLQQTWAGQAGVPQSAAKLVSLKAGSWQGLPRGGIENVSLMPHLDAWACSGDLAASAMALGWQQEREAGTHGCWCGNEPSVALTRASACWAVRWQCHVCPLPRPLRASCAAWTRHCTQGDTGPGTRAQPLAGQPRSRLNRIE